ncbi:MFS transporter, partial [Xenorhabdus sp. IM139775]|nr:MFS transporter [Xenorhabdus sp. IM139775]
ISFIVFSFCFFWRAYTFESGMDFSSASWPQFVQGIAIACFIMPLNVIILSDIPQEKVASAGSLFNFFRTLAISIGTSLTNTLWSQREAVHHSQLTENITQNNFLVDLAYQDIKLLGLSDLQATIFLAKKITNQSLILAANEIFWLFGFIFLSLILILWLARSNLSST